MGHAQQGAAALVYEVDLVRPDPGAAPSSQPKL
jgi:hypothetical protein